MDDISPDSETGIRLKQEHYQLMLVDVQQRLPEEACGIIAGVDGTSVRVFSLRNIYHSTTDYRLDPKEQIAIFNRMEQNGWDLLGIYHSHPSGPPHPSSTDINKAYYPETAYIIWTKDSQDWVCKAFRISHGQVASLPITLIP